MTRRTLGGARGAGGAARAATGAGPPAAPGPAAESAAAYLRGLGLDGFLRAAWVKVGRYGVAGRLPTARLGPAQARALEGLLGERVVAGRSVDVRRLDAALRRSRFACGLAEALAAWFGPPAETPGAQARRRATETAAFLGLTADAWAGAGVPQRQAEAVLRREFVRARRSGDVAVAAVRHAAAAVAVVLADPPARRGEAALLGILANRTAGDPHAFDPGTVGGRLLLGALGASPGAGALRRQEVLARAGIAVDGISSAVAVYGIAGEGDRAAAAAAAAGEVLVAPLRHVLRWALPAEAWAGRAVHVLENPPVFEALVERGMPQGAALVCTSGFPSAAAVVLLGALARAGAAVRYSGDFDANGLQIAARVLGVGGGDAAARAVGTWEPWRMGPEDYLAAVAAARGRAVREPDERRALEGLAAVGTGDGATMEAAASPRVPLPWERVLAATAAAVLQRGFVAYQESLVLALWDDVWARHGGAPSG